MRAGPGQSAVVNGGEDDNEFLLGAGLGLELQVQRNLNVRVDWGWALQEETDGEDPSKIVNIEDGSQQIHIVATLVY